MNYRSFVQKKLNTVQLFPLLVTSPVAVFMMIAAVHHLTVGEYMDAVVMLAISAVMWYIFIRELPISRFRKYGKEVEKLGEPAQVFAHLESLKPNIFADGVDLRFDGRYIAYVGAGEAAVKSAGDLVWAHLHDELVSRKMGGLLPMGTERRRGVMVRFVDGSSFVIRLPGEEACIDILEELKAAYPYMMMGYEPQLEAIYNKDPRELWSAAGYQNRQDETV